jgi:peptidoglycan/LPS O-acetylase OafA/YrhL
MKDRSEIDGLRALSVLSVIFFHAGFSSFSGGYVGVDVFFVISGYLITSIITRELNSGTFSLKRFYERRAKRILPALFFVVTVTCFFTWQWMLPKQLEDFCKSIVSVLVFSSNIFFWQQSGYFSPSNGEKPLIHTWSLSLEEQFYFFFPLLLIWLWRFGKEKTLKVIVALLLLSLSLAHWGATAKPVATFYLLPTRAWELLMGSLLALVSFQVSEKKEKWLAALGLVLIGLGVFTFSYQTPDPSILTLIPTLGACLVILAAKPSNFVGRLLGTPFLAGIGLLSYSAYLWHQPIFSLARIRSVTPLEAPQFLALIVLVFVLAAFTWKFVESPLRRNNLKVRKQGFALLAGFSFILFVFSIGGVWKQGLPSRLSEKALKFASASVYYPPQCPDISDGDAPTEADSICIIGDKSKKPTLAILGDSHAGALTDVLGENLAKQGRAAVSLWAWSCAPLLDFEIQQAPKNEKCKPAMNSAIQQVLKDESIKNVVLVSFWTHYVNDSHQNNEVFESALKRTAQALIDKNKKVIFVKTVPEQKTNIAEALTKKAMMGGDLALSIKHQIDRKAYISENKSLQEVLNSLETFPGFKVVNTEDVFCKENLCKYIDENGNAFYRDTNHLSPWGAKEILPAILQHLIKG